MAKMAPDPVVSVMWKDVTHQKDDGGHEHCCSMLSTKPYQYYVACPGAAG
ncbi:MAG: hypothetical protein ACYCVY_00360 [Acidiferrobacteraceae bacterium]